MNTNSMDRMRTENVRSERRIVRNRIRRKREMRKNFLIFAVTVCLIAGCSVTLSGFRSNAKSDSAPAVYKYYKSITVAGGDTLWSIAEDYMDEEHYGSIYEYIREVMQINNLKNDAIYADAHLIVPYYDTVIK